MWNTLDTSVSAGPLPRRRHFSLRRRLRLAPLGRPSHSTTARGSVRPPPHFSTQPKTQFRARCILLWLVIAAGGVTQTVTAQVTEIQVLPSELSPALGEQGNLIATHLPAHIARSRCGACTCGATIDTAEGATAAPPSPLPKANATSTRQTRDVRSPLLYGKYNEIADYLCKYIEIPNHY